MAIHLALSALFFSLAIHMPAAAPGNFANPDAVREVLEGKRDTANAAWWGFQPEDSTEALQAAIRSGAKRVIVPNMTKDWIVRPIELAGNQELILEDGVVVTAKRGEFRGRGDSLFTAQDLSNLTIRGYGATLRMQKEDYIYGRVLADLKWDRQFGPYPPAEWRMALSLLGVTNVNVFVLTLRDSGGDGIFVAGGQRKHSSNVHIKDVVCDNHYRQGISVISVDGLLVENSVFKNTWGTPPSAGVDIEPDTPAERVHNVVFRHCRFEDNYGDGIEIFLAHLKPESGDVSILFDDCRVSSRRGAGIRVTKVADDGPGGLIEFRDCTVENTEAYGIKVQDKSALRARVKFVNCTLRNTAVNRMFAGAWAPVWLHLFRPELTRRFGGIDFMNCSVEDRHDRPVLVVEGPKGDFKIADLTGNITVSNPYGVRSAISARKEGVTLVLSQQQ